MIFIDILKYVSIIALLLVVIAFVILVIWSSNRGVLVYAANERGETFIHTKQKSGKTSIEQALEVAEPYLQETLDHIRRRRGGGRYSVINNYVILKGKWYYIFKDDYPWKVLVIEIPGKYEGVAIRVNVDSGEVIPTIK